VYANQMLLVQGILTIFQKCLLDDFVFFSSITLCKGDFPNKIFSRVICELQSCHENLDVLI